METKYPNMEAEMIRLGLDSKKLALVIGVSAKTVSGWLMGHRPIPNSFLKSICEKLGCSADYLLSASRYDERWRNYREIKAYV